MNILAIDTTTTSTNVTLDIDGKDINKSINDKSTHSEKLLPLIDECLKQGNLRVPDIDTFCVTTGPGSFTGIRIGIATIKAFAKVSNAKVFASSSLEVIGYESVVRNIESNFVLSLMDARNSRVYYCLYNTKNNILIQVIEPANDSISEAINIVNEYFNGLNTINVAEPSLTVIGDCVDLYNKILEESLNIKSKLVSASISSKTLVTMAKNYMINTNVDSNKYIYNYANLDAAYIRPSQAERIKNGEQY